MNTVVCYLVPFPDTNVVCRPDVGPTLAQPSLLSGLSFTFGYAYGGHAYDTHDTFSLTLIAAWISYYIHYKVWDEIIFPFLNFNGATVVQPLKFRNG